MLPKVLLVAGVASSLAVILADCSTTIEAPASDVVCPVRCEDMFGKLKNGVQEVHVQIRGGEPRGRWNMAIRSAPIPTWSTFCHRNGLSCA